jgi:hypothetical protein
VDGQDWYDRADNGRTTAIGRVIPYIAAAGRSPTMIEINLYSRPWRI